MANVIITGTSHGIGRCIASTLLDNGYTVFGINRTKSGLSHPAYHEIIYDLSHVNGLDSMIDSITGSADINVLINNAGIAYYGPAETISSAHICEMMTVNAAVPMILTSRLLRALEKTHGMIINISSITAKNTGNSHGAVYGATKAALSSFGDSVFTEARKRGIRVSNVHPDLTQSMLYRNADFEPDSDELCHLTADDVAKEILHIITTPEGVVLRDITISPQLFRISRRKNSDD